MVELNLQPDSTQAVKTAKQKEKEEKKKAEKAEKLEKLRIKNLKLEEQKKVSGEGDKISKKDEKLDAKSGIVAVVRAQTLNYSVPILVIKKGLSLDWGLKIKIIAVV